jgi:tRNA(Arg) A34 adenosine deaminase TadA
VTSWSELPELWRRCFELAWESHLEGSNPIAALIADARGRVVATGKSAVRAPVSGVAISHNELAHAEVNALLELDNRVHGKDKASAYTLYATLEPCPVCFCAFYMSDVASLRFAARDRFGGSVNLLGTTPYLSRKQRLVVGPEPLLEEFSIFLNVAHDLDAGLPMDDPVHLAMALDCPGPVALARDLAGEAGDILDCRQDVPAVFERFSALRASRG